MPWHQWKLALNLPPIRRSDKKERFVVNLLTTCNISIDSIALTLPVENT